MKKELLLDAYVKRHLPTNVDEDELISADKITDLVLHVMDGLLDLTKDKHPEIFELPRDAQIDILKVISAGAMDTMMRGIGSSIAMYIDYHIGECDYCEITTCPLSANFDEEAFKEGKRKADRVYGLKRYLSGKASSLEDITHTLEDEK